MTENQDTAVANGFAVLGLSPELLAAVADLGYTQPTQVQQQDLKDLIAKRKTGGLGMRLIKTLMDEVHYDIEPGKRNELRMVKKLRK